MRFKDIHTEHCCVNCGCKYGEDREEEDDDGEVFVGCSVVAKLRRQSFKCGKTSVCCLDEYDEARI